jgi:hypothetical protein
MHRHHTGHALLIADEDSRATIALAMIALAMIVPET